MADLPALPPVNTSGKKLAVGWFSFTCSEDSTILFTELLNDHLEEWKKFVDFKYLKALKMNNQIEGLDVAFVEGAISSEKQAAELKRIRENAKVLVAIGSCACTGQPSATRNNLFDNEINYKVYWYFSHFDYSHEVKKLEDLVKVDEKVMGCPMNADSFIGTLARSLKTFNII